MGALNITPSSAKTATGQSSAIHVYARERIALLADVTAVSGGTPSMTLSIEWSNDGSTWFTGDPADTFAAITAATKKTKDFAVRGNYARLVWTISGSTPSFTFAAYLWLRDSKGQK